MRTSMASPAVDELFCAQRLRAGRSADDAFRYAAPFFKRVDETGVQQEFYLAPQEDLLQHDGENLVIEDAGLFLSYG